MPRSTKTNAEGNLGQGREIVIGIQGGREPFSREWLVSMAAVDAVARVRGSIMITVYAAETPKAGEG